MISSLASHRRDFVLLMTTVSSDIVTIHSFLWPHTTIKWNKSFDWLEVGLGVNKF
jgi:hypothetical protein